MKLVSSMELGFCVIDMNPSDIFCFKFFLALFILCILSMVSWAISWVLAVKDTSSTDACPLFASIAIISGGLAAIMAGMAMGQFIDIQLIDIVIK